MNPETLHPLADDYLRRLKRAARDLLAAQRDELLADITSHVTDAIPPSAGEAEVRDVLERLGSPEDIVAATQPEVVQTSAVGRDAPRAREVIAVILLLCDIPPVLGWVVGVVLLWASDRWRLSDKILGTLIVPGGLFLPFWLSVTPTGAEVCSGPPDGYVTCTYHGLILPSWLGLSLPMTLVVAPIVMAIVLIRRAKVRST